LATLKSQVLWISFYKNCSQSMPDKAQNIPMTTLLNV